MEAIAGETKKSGFKPFHLDIVIESVDEARVLWHRLNAPWDAMLNASIKTDIINAYPCLAPVSGSSQEAFHQLNVYMTNHNLKTKNKE